MDWLRKNNDGDNGKSDFFLKSDRGMGSHSSAQPEGYTSNYPTLETGFGFNGEYQSKSKPNSEESLYPTVIDTNTDRDSVFSEPIKQNSLYIDIHFEQYHPTVSLYPSMHTSDLVENQTFFSLESQENIKQDLLSPSLHAASCLTPVWEELPRYSGRTKDLPNEYPTTSEI